MSENDSDRSANHAGKNAEVIDLAHLTKREGFVIAAGGDGGWSVSAAGDVNGDGFADVLVGAPTKHDPEDEQFRDGTVTLIYGRDHGFSTEASGDPIMHATKLTDAQGASFVSSIDYDSVGFSVASAGDINGDGFDDMIVTSISNDQHYGHGEARIIFGGPKNFNHGFTIDTPSFEGRAVAAAGDVNGDGFDDIIVSGGSQYADGSFRGAYVIFGTDQGFATTGQSDGHIVPGDLTASQGFFITGNNLTYTSPVSSAGDVNGDGYADLIIGSSADTNKAYVIFGSGSGFGTTDGSGQQVVDVDNLSPSQGFVLQGQDVGPLTEVSSAGDVNGDGIDDLIVGGQSGDGSVSRNAYVVFGTKAGFGTDVDGEQVVDLASLDKHEGFLIRGFGGGDAVSDSAVVSSAGDVNGDGYDDLIVGSPDAGGKHAGEAFVIFGSAKGFGTNVDGHREVNVNKLTADEGFKITGDLKHGVSDQTGFSVSAAGDVNGDGFDDIMVGAPGSNKAYVLFGGKFGSDRVDTKLAGTTGDDVLVGHAGDDVLNGKGGHDIIRGGAGNDTIKIADADVTSIDAGNGRDDTVMITGANVDFDARDFTNSQLTGIEAFDLTGTGNNSLTIAADDIFHFSNVGNKDFTAADSHNNLVVYGNFGDTLNLVDYASSDAHWTLVAPEHGLSSKHGDFDIYNLVSENTGGHETVLASVAVSHDMNTFSGDL